MNQPIIMGKFTVVLGSFSQEPFLCIYTSTGKHIHIYDDGKVV